MFDESELEEDFRRWSRALEDLVNKRAAYQRALDSGRGSLMAWGRLRGARERLRQRGERLMSDPIWADRCRVELIREGVVGQDVTAPDHEGDTVKS